MIVGHDKDWLCLSPYALQHWESLLLEPYSYSRDVAYVVVAPDNDAILPRVKTFFKVCINYLSSALTSLFRAFVLQELSTAYEICKLGRHSPITKVLRDGILRVGKAAKTNIGNEPVEEWFSLLGDGETSDMLRLYAQVCKHHLAPHLQQVPMDKTLLDPPVDNTAAERPAPSPMPPPSTPDPNISSSQSSTPDKAPSTPKSDQGNSSVHRIVLYLNSSVYIIFELIIVQRKSTKLLFLQPNYLYVIFYNTIIQTTNCYFLLHQKNVKFFRRRWYEGQSKFWKQWLGNIQRRR